MTALPDPESLLERLAGQIAGWLRETGRPEPLMIGIHTGGDWIAERLHRLLGLTEPRGRLDISFYRDDFTRVGINPTVRPSQLPFGVDDRHLLLVDDVLHTGRTVRAALNELFDYGRPAAVALAVLIDRNERELPFAADFVGTRLALAPDEHVKLSGPVHGIAHRAPQRRRQDTERQ